MKRRLFNAGALVSLVMLLVFAGLWVRSYWIADALGVQIPQFGDPARHYDIEMYTGRGGLFVGLVRAAAWESGVLATRPRPPEVLRYRTRKPYYPVKLNLLQPDVRGVRWAGFEFTAYHYAPGASSSGYGIVGQYYAVTPCWFWMGVSLVVPVVWWWRRHQLIAFACPACGYDLRGTPSGGTCPECGAATPARDPASPRA